MRTQAGLMVTLLVAVLGLPTESPAQSQRGLFGERELGKPLKPGVSRFRGGLERGPSGNFLGRSTADRGTTFQPRSRSEPTSPWLLPPEGPDMVPSYVDEQARRMAAAYEYQQQQLRQLYQRQRPQQPIQPTFPPVMPERPDRYLPPPMPVQPGFPQPQPRVPGPEQQSPLQNSPDRWFRGAPAQTQPGAMAPTTNPSGSSQRYVPMPGLGPVGSLGPSGVAGQAGLNRSNPATLGPRITQTLGARVLAPISATIQGDTVILQGTVATAADRQLADRMAAMEPGVRRIDNRINVEVAPAGP